MDVVNPFSCVAPSPDSQALAVPAGTTVSRVAAFGIAESRVG